MKNIVPIILAMIADGGISRENLRALEAYVGSVDFDDITSKLCFRNGRHYIDPIFGDRFKNA